jgi:hypothetical protein
MLSQPVRSGRRDSACVWARPRRAKYTQADTIGPETVRERRLPAAIIPVRLVDSHLISITQAFGVSTRTRSPRGARPSDWVM